MDPNLYFWFQGNKFTPIWEKNVVAPAMEADQDKEEKDHFLSGSVLVHMGWLSENEGGGGVPSVSG